MDDVDLANDKSQQFNDDLINRIRNKAKDKSFPFTESCYYCDANITSPKVFCDLDCRNDYDREKRLLAMRGSRRIN